MLSYGKSALSVVAQPRVAIAIMTAALVLGGSVSEASAKSRHHRHHLSHVHHASRASLMDANASVAPTSGRSFTGIASYYGNESGSRTASGQRFNQSAMTAAHRSLPFGTKLRVTHDGRSVVVTVNDRGPFIRGRVLDLSKGAASAIGLTSSGVGRVVAEVL